MRALLPALAACLALQAAAFASSSAWSEAEGARVRLVTTGQPDASGMLTGALEIELAPGWKTYWRDPGDAGVPPSFDVSASPSIESATLSFPAPERVDDGSTKWAGYKRPVTFAVTFKTKPGEALPITADVFLGVCETICVPLQARLELDPGHDPDNADDAVAVKAAFDALPAPATPDFGLTPLPSGPDAMLFEARFPGGEADLFVVTPDGYVLGTPERRDADGKAVFAVPVLDRPGTAPESGFLAYTLVTGAGAVEGMAAVPAEHCCKPRP